MKNYNSFRVRKRNGAYPLETGKFVLYWMQINSRFHYNFALEYAVGWANKLKLPLLIFEGLSCDYPWATARTHQFLLEGMSEHSEAAEGSSASYLPYVEQRQGEYSEMLKQLVEDAALLVTDEYPVFIMRSRNEQLSSEWTIPYYTVDSNGMIPLGRLEKDPYSAYLFRKVVQREFIESYTHPPEENPLEKVENREEVSFPEWVSSEALRSAIALKSISDVIRMSSIRQDIGPVSSTEGARRAGLRRLTEFLDDDLPVYGDSRNDPDHDRSSRLSPWLHTGKLSEYEIVKKVLNRQPDSWDLDRIVWSNGSASGFYNGDQQISKFLDELIVWRGVGFHFAHHRSDYDQFESLPDWALKTLQKHQSDPRESIYSYEELEQARTHDLVWNAAQNQLREDGVIHNYLRMLWGKKVIEWTPDPETALRYLIDLNNSWALDGRDPNSYSGIFWCFGRFDRAWQERPVFGKVRYMTSQSARKKLAMEEYLKTFGNPSASDTR
ncbi:MAG: hypothetical protein WD355_06720 [Balneolaceae bacterium]